jgi:glutamate-1-semialdehyde 2,1-aminomutase
MEKDKLDFHDLIPGGCHTYSKGDDQFSSNAPRYLVGGKGAYCSDGINEFLDCGMGLASITLGHGFEEVNDAVVETIKSGTNFMRPSLLEFQTAEKFLEMIPHHSMIKFAKNGSTATTAAVKLARAYTNRKLIAVPIDHPFYSYDDWFIGSTAADFGVPSEIKNLTVGYKSCSIESLSEIFQKFGSEIAAVISEPEKNWCSNCDCGTSPEVFLKSAIKLCEDEGALFILDEMQSGYRLAFPGAMSRYNLKPHLTTWGKGIANGFSFCALTGIKEVMELGGIKNIGSRKLFLISTTNGAESVGLAAAIATNKFYRENNVIDHIHMIGTKIIEVMYSVIRSYNMEKYLIVLPCNWMPGLKFNDIDETFASDYLKTFVIQEMVKNGVLFQGVFVPSFSHTLSDVEFFKEGFERSIKNIANWISDKNAAGVDGALVKPVFRKYI